MPNGHFIRRRGPIHHASALPNTQIRRRLERLSQKHKNSMVRLASQRDAFSQATPRQDRCFAAALIENWCLHLLHNKELYGRSDLLPQVPLPSAQLKIWQKQLSQWKEVKVSRCSPSLHDGQHSWPSADAITEQTLLYDGRSLTWAKKILLAQGAQLHLLTKQKVNHLCLSQASNLEADDFWLSQIRKTVHLLAKNKQHVNLTLPSQASLEQRQSIFVQAWQSLKLWSEQKQTARLIIDYSLVKDFLQAAARDSSLSLEKRSRIFVLISATDKNAQELLNQRNQIAAYFGLAPERLSWLWLDPETSFITWSCSQGHFHLPIYYRLSQENGQFYLCNPLSANYPNIYSKFKGKILAEYACSCGFSAPSIELE